MRDFIYIFPILLFLVHGEWGEWGAWGTCQEHSPGEGTKEIRTREYKSKWSLDNENIDCEEPDNNQERRDCDATELGKTILRVQQIFRILLCV